MVVHSWSLCLMCDVDHVNVWAEQLRSAHKRSCQVCMRRGALFASNVSWHCHSCSTVVSTLPLALHLQQGGA